MNVAYYGGNGKKVKRVQHNSNSHDCGWPYSTRVRDQDWARLAVQRRSHRKAPIEPTSRAASKTIGEAPQMQGPSAAEHLRTALLIIALFASGFMADLIHAGVLI